MEEVNTTEETLGEESQLNSAPVESAVEPVSGGSTPESLTLKELNEFLGKDFKDKGTALKAVKDTFSYVGKKKEDIASELMSNQNTELLSKEIKQIKENMFYAQNPELSEYRSLLAKIDSNPEVASQSAEFKTIFEKAKGYDESSKLKTVLQSSPRLASSRDNLSKASEAYKSGNRDAAESHIAKAVLETLEG